MGIYGNCYKNGCNEKLHGLNSKICTLMDHRVCLKHLSYENHDCPKVIYTKYIRKTWIMKRGQNVTTGMYTIVCETCGFVSEFPSLIEYSGAELEAHLKSNPECMSKKRTFLEELVSEPMEKSKIQSSIVHDPNRTLWVCSHCRPPRKFTSHNEYINHHFMHN